jgi:hypothetical protein
VEIFCARAGRHPHSHQEKTRQKGLLPMAPAGRDKRNEMEAKALAVSAPSVARLTALERILPLITKRVRTNSDDRRASVAWMNRGEDGKNTHKRSLVFCAQARFMVFRGSQKRKHM